MIEMDLPTFLSIEPELWGPSFWLFLDSIIVTYPKENPSIEQRNAVYSLLQSLRYLLPCPVCRKHYNEFIQKHNIDNFLYSRKTIVNFYFLLKKDVNSRTHQSFPFKSPDDLLYNITQRFKLVKAKPQSFIHTLRQQKPLRVPVRTNTILTHAKKGCGCSKK